MQLRTLTPQILAISLAVALLAACSPAKKLPPVATWQSTSPAPAANAARLVIYRPSSRLLHIRAPSIKLNDAKLCDLYEGSYFMRDVAVQQLMVSSSLWDEVWSSKLALTPQPGATYYIRVSVDSGKVDQAMGAAIGAGIGGALGGAVAAGTSGSGKSDAAHQGSFALDLMGESGALSDIKSLATTNCN